MLFSCEENKLPPGNDCPSYIEGWESTLQSTFIYRNYNFSTPVFNPNNADEFAYIRKPPLAVFNYELRKHKISTGEDNLISNIYYCGFQLNWSNTDWILFNQTVYDVWKVKSDGTGMIQLTSSGMNMNPSWKPDGSAFIYGKDGSSSIIADANGNSIDTINTFIYPYTWSVDDQFLYGTTYLGQPIMAVYDLQSGTSQLLTSTPQYQEFRWLPNGVEFIGSYNGELWLVNSQTEERSLIKTNCGDKYQYFSFAISPTGTKILVDRIEAILVDSFTYEINFDIVLMDIDGKNEQVISLPQ